MSRALSWFAPRRNRTFKQTDNNFNRKNYSVPFFICIFAPAKQKRSGFSAVGSVLRSGRRGRWFESSNPDLLKETGWYAACLFCFLWPSYLFFSLCEEYLHSLWFHGKYPVHRRFCLVRNRKLVLTAWQWYAFVALKCSFGGLRLTLARFS